MTDKHANADYAFQGRTIAPIDDPPRVVGNAAGATYVGAANDAPDQAEGSAGAPLSADEGYGDASKESLEGEIQRRGLEVPTEGSGANGNVVKQDLIDVLEDDDTK